MAKTYPIPDDCPVCSGNYVVSQLRCSSCGTKLEGNFSTGAFSNLDEKQLLFITAFLSNRGNIQNTGKQLGISYPTVKSRLDNALKTMGLYMDSEDDILEKVKSGEITIEEAAKILASKKK
ncbi:MAG: DUF2089 domain-containing protein [Clostridiales bacterium]|nr:DUF2089 domain-containing protein [Clostridiales bacterium]